MARQTVENLLELPIELLELIIGHVSYDEMARIRLVCRAFDACAQRLLNRGFIKVEKYHALCFKRVKSQLPRRESERRTHPLARHCDVLSAIETRLSLLGMTYMKYVDMSLCCFIPGKVIDEIYRVLRFIQNNPNPPRVHELLQELRDISSMAMEYFEERIAPSLKGRLSSSSNVMAVVSAAASPSTSSSVAAVSCGRSSLSLSPIYSKANAGLCDLDAKSMGGSSLGSSTAHLTGLMKQMQQSQNTIKRELTDIKVKLKDCAALRREIGGFKAKVRELEKSALEKDQTIAEIKAQLEDLKRRMCEYDEKGGRKGGMKEVSQPMSSTSRGSRREPKARRKTSRKSSTSVVIDNDHEMTAYVNELLATVNKTKRIESPKPKRAANEKWAAVSGVASVPHVGPTTRGAERAARERTASVEELLTSVQEMPATRKRNPTANRAAVTRKKRKI